MIEGVVPAHMCAKIENWPAVRSLAAVAVSSHRDSRCEISSATVPKNSQFAHQS